MPLAPTNPPQPSVEPASEVDQRLALVLGSVAVFLVGLELTIISLALPEMRASFPETSRATLSWVFTAFNLVVASLLLPGGWLADHLGRRRVFLWGMAVFTFGSVLAGLAPTPGVLILARVVQAVGGALTLPASLALILHTTTVGRRDVAVAIWGAAAGLAAAIGPSLGAVLVDRLGWRSVFLINVPIALGAFFVGMARLANTPGTARRGVDLLAVPAAALGAGALVLAFSAWGARGWHDPATLISAGLAVAFIAVFVRRTTRHRQPLIEPALLTERSFAIGSAGTLLFVAGFTGWLVLAPTFLTEVWGYSVLSAGLAIAPGPLLMAAVAGPAGKIASRRGHRGVIVTGALLSATALSWWCVSVDTTPDYLGAFLPGLLVLGIGVGMAFPMLTSASLVAVPPERFGVAAAGNTTARQLAMALGIGLAIAVVGEPATTTAGLGAFRSSWIVSLALVLAAAVISLRLPRPSINSRSDPTRSTS